MQLFFRHTASQARNNSTALISQCHNPVVSRVSLTRKCSFHLNNVIKADLHLKGEGRMEELWSLWAFRDCNTKFSSEVKWMWTGVWCSADWIIQLFFSRFLIVCMCRVYDTYPKTVSAGFGKPRPSIDPINICNWGERLTVLINWDEIIMLQSVTLTVESSCCDELNCSNTNTCIQMWDVHLVSFL